MFSLFHATVTAMPTTAQPTPMSSDSKNPTTGEDASKLVPATGAPDNEVNPETLETFEIDVTAGNSLPQPESTSSNSAPTPIANRTRRAGPATTQPNEIEESPRPSALDDSICKPAAKAKVTSTPQTLVVTQQTDTDHGTSSTTRRVARQSSWWVTSLGIHAIGLLILAFTTLVIIQPEELELTTTAVVYEPVEEFEDLEIDPSEDLETLEEELSEPDPALLEALDSEMLVEEPAITEASASESPATDIAGELSNLGDLFSETGGGLTGMDSEVGVGTGGGMAKFFGTEVKAKRILYMLDNSGGMRKKGKFEALVAELKRSVSGLDAKQEFYVVFYSDTVYPLFFPQGVRKFVRPNERNFKLLDRWLDTVELCGGNAIDEALAAAELIRPETVFLLTDGDLFTTDKKRALLLNPAGRSYSIHTFGLGVGENTKTADGLRQVAEANSGTFRPIKVTDEMAALAREMQRPYHNKEPGPVWGLKVGRFR